MTTVITAPDPSLTDTKYGPFLVLKDVKAQIDSTLKVLEGTQPKDTGLMTELMTLSSEVVVAANAWQTTELSELQAKAKELSGRYDAFRPRIPLIQGFAASTGEMILNLLVGLAVLVGGIIGSHYFIDVSIQQRLFYFIYGAALFPITLLFACFVPPTVWRASLIPLVEGTPGLLSYQRPSPLDKPSNVFRILSATLLTTIFGFYFFLYGRLPV